MNTLSFFIYAFTSLFVIVNPVSGVLTFEALTARMSPVEKRRIAAKTVWIAFLVGLAFAVTGEFILRLFGITADSIRVAGGILLFKIAMDMLHARTSREGVTPEEMEDASFRDDISVFPMAIPVLTGPGTISTIIVLMRSGPSLEQKAATLLALLATFAISYFIFRHAHKVIQFLGATVALVINRIMGLLLGAIAVNFVAQGVWNIYQSFLP